MVVADNWRAGMDSLLRDELLQTSQLGLCVYDLTADTLLYAFQSRQRMRPASTEGSDPAFVVGRAACPASQVPKRERRVPFRPLPRSGKFRLYTPCRAQPLSLCRHTEELPSAPPDPTHTAGRYTLFSRGQGRVWSRAQCLSTASPLYFGAPQSTGRLSSAVLERG